jgi:hypothetical protein
MYFNISTQTITELYEQAQQKFQQRQCLGSDQMHEVGMKYIGSWLQNSVLVFMALVYLSMASCIFN